MVIIRKMEIKQRYRYVWLKYVDGFDLSQHCAKCLRGTYEKRVNRDTFSYRDIELPPSPYYYFCTVYQYDTNIHLAFVEAEGETITIEDDRYSVVIENARQIHFDASRINYALPGARLKAFNTCRNWQFANWIMTGDREHVHNVIIHPDGPGEPEKSITEFHKRHPNYNGPVVALPEKDKDEDI
jgi:hypothetical protein